MVNDPLKTEILYDLMSSLLEPVTEQEILETAVPVYIRKLNCFMAAVIKVDGDDLSTAYILPANNNRNKTWNDLYTQFKADCYTKHKRLVELERNGELFYCYELKDYGFIVLGRKQPFEHHFKKELIHVFDFLSKAIMQDIQRKKMQTSEVSLRRERTLLRTIIDNIPIHIYAKDHAFRNILANKANLDFVGMESESLLQGKTDSEVFGTEASKNSQIEDEQVFDHSKNIINQEKVIYSPDGEEHYALISKLPLDDEDGKAVGIVGMTIDISERKRMEKIMVRKQRMLQGVTHATEAFIDPGNMHEALENSLTILAKALDVSCATFWWYNNEKNHPEKEKIVWSKKDSMCYQQVGDTGQQRIFDAIRDNLETFEPSVIRNDENFRGVIPAFDETSKPTYLLIIPIVLRGELYGVFCFQDMDSSQVWGEDELLLLKSYGQSFSSALEIDLRSKEVQDIALFTKENPAPVVRIDLEGQVLLENGAAKHLSQTADVNEQQVDIYRWYKSIARLLSPKYYAHSEEIIHGTKTYLANAILSKSKKYINIYFADITVQKSAEKKLIEFNERMALLENIIDKSKDALQIAYADGTIFYINKEASKRLGAPRNEVVGKTIDQYATFFNNRSLWGSMVENLRKEGSLTIEGKHAYPNTNNPFPVEVSASYMQIGQQEFVVSNARDITERKESEKKLILQEEKYRNILSNMQLGLLEVDVNDKIQFCNKSFSSMSGYSLQELKNKVAADFLFFEEKHIEQAAGSPLLVVDEPISYEIQTHNRNGELKWWLVSAARNFNDKGENTGAVGIVMDVTSQKKLSDELQEALVNAQEASKAKEHFLANMSHEIRTPLNGIIGMVRELKNSSLTNAQQEYVNSAIKASHHLLSIINNILDITKIEAGELDLMDEHFAVSSLLGDVKSILKSQADKKGIGFKTHLDGNIPDAMIGDVLRLRQIMVNIAGNSIKFTEEGFVSIKFVMMRENESMCYTEHRSACNEDCNAIFGEEPGDRLKIVIRDTGIGMDKSYSKRMYQKFQQEDSSVSRKYGGTGLGLVITKQLIDLMGGVIQVKSEKGVGTETIICLPFRIGDMEKVLVKDTNMVLPDLSQMKVLLVEDNEMNRLVACNSLSQLNIDPDEADDGQVAVEKVKLREYDLILMDIQMPIMNGLEATSIIRKQLKKQMPILALTAQAFSSEVEKFKEVGMNDYITKPFEEIDFLTKIASYAPRDLKQTPSVDLPEKERVKHTAEEDVRQTVSDDKMYDLSTLRKMSGDDDTFIKSIVQLFCETTPETLDRADKAMEAKDYISIRKSVHEIKPAVLNMNITGATEDILFIQSYEIDQGDAEKFKEKYMSLKEKIWKAIKQLKEDFPENT